MKHLTEAIVINDSDGHTSVLNYNLDNLRKCLEAFVEAGMCNNEEGAKSLLAGDPTCEQVEEFLLDTCSVNGRGGECHILEVSDWNYHWNPFE